MGIPGLMSRYAELGIDVEKRGIEVFRKIIDNLFPNAFCPVTKDRFNENLGVVMHTDGAGSKPLVSYIYWKEFGELEKFKGISQDVIAMNVDDIVCVGAKPLYMIDYIAINTFNLPKERVLKVLSEGFSETLRSLTNFGIHISFLGGETAELPDQLSTIDVSAAMFGIVELSRIVLSLIHI